jgi:hypothetical protein
LYIFFIFSFSFMLSFKRNNIKFKNK